ncbi:hypothetical protein BDV28DRAFT_67908 [Aspergillus coremiiformis]|uniref:Zn(2)-C6 fungal-type domain-containing protein n=1 Tax=Aspergillus coremiiformis TaxID=138285 RepID=A0A5N6ZFH9_9EURO|nr:hypothetical protein BDV28DRAFT_67908 [Aspergillus coremiiformis]
MNSLAERGNPPSRRKSCEACKTAKRRCDLAFPACSRCATRNMPCIYPGRQPAIPQALIDEALASIAQIDGGPVSVDGVIDFNLPDLPDLPMVVDDIDFASPGLSIPPPGTSDIIPRATFTMTASQTRSPMPLSAIIASRLQFAIDVLKDVPKMMVLENQNPWCHQQLYKDSMPKLMQGKSSKT